jgi:hypothetical protein
VTTATVIPHRRGSSRGDAKSNSGEVRMVAAFRDKRPMAVRTRDILREIDRRLALRYQLVAILIGRVITDHCDQPRVLQRTSRISRQDLDLRASRHALQFEIIPQQCVQRKPLGPRAEWSCDLRLRCRTVTSCSKPKRRATCCTISSPLSENPARQDLGIANEHVDGEQKPSAGGLMSRNRESKHLATDL